VTNEGATSLQNGCRCAVQSHELRLEIRVTRKFMQTSVL
jgi:hypothetical protein